MRDKIFRFDKQTEPFKKSVIEKISVNDMKTANQVKWLFDTLEKKVDKALIKRHFIYAANICALNMDARLSEIAVLLLVPVAVFSQLDEETEKGIVKNFDKDFLNNIKTLAEKYTKNSDDEKTAVTVYNDVCDIIINRRFADIEKEYPKSDVIKNAFILARKAHSNAVRKTEEPYIVHPLSVAEILTEEKMIPDIIAAALLHDVCEDNRKEYPLNKIEDCTNYSIRTLVDAVTKLDEKDKTFDYNKEDLDDETLNKLCRMVANDKTGYIRNALFIKAADRIHNLRTIDCFSSEKRREKVAETQKYLFLFRKFEVNKLSDIIDDLCFKIENREMYEALDSKYHIMLRENTTSSDLFDKTLANAIKRVNQCIADNLPYTHKGYEYEIIKQEHLPYEIYEKLTAKIKNIDYSKVYKEINKSNISLYKNCIVLDPLDKVSDIRSFVKAFGMNYGYYGDFSENGICISEINFDSKNRCLYFEAEDALRSRIECRVFMRMDYNNYINGNNNVRVDREVAFMEDLLDAVTVYTESGEELRLPKGSTVIDFAFKISAGSGKTLYKAKINNEDASIFSELHSGEKVEIFSYAKKDEDSKGLETVKIKWLNNVATDNARRQITKYLEEKLER